MSTDNIHPTESSTSPSRDVRSSSSSVPTSIFNNAINTRITNSSFVVSSIQSPGDPLNKLYIEVATNALNAGGHADDIRCYPGTRVEVIDSIERWMDSGGKDDIAPNMMWLSGPAGAGKSAIVQTIAERCEERGVLAASFFFLREDPTRSTAQPLVATLLYQIIEVSPTARHVIATALSDDPLVFGTPIRRQFKKLLSSPLHRTSQSPGSPARRPIVLLIDGLDECDFKNTSSQRQILQALDQLVTQKDSPFLVLVASRTEPQIAMAFNQLSSSVQSILLDDRYAPEKDIRIFVTGEFDKIKKSHYLTHTFSDSLPSAYYIDPIVRKSSGRFIYAATVMRSLSNSSNPMLSLEKAQGVEESLSNSTGEDAGVSSSPELYTWDAVGKGASRHDVVIFVVGLTGAGKSTFIRGVASSDCHTVIVPSDGLDSGTNKFIPVIINDYSRLSTGSVEKLKRGRLIIVDTPGYDDTHVHPQYLQIKLGECLKAMGHQKMYLGGVIYLFDTTQTRMKPEKFAGHLKPYEDLLPTPHGSIVLGLTGFTGTDVHLARKRHLESEHWKHYIRVAGSDCVMTFSKVSNEEHWKAFDHIIKSFKIIDRREAYEKRILSLIYPYRKKEIRRRNRFRRLFTYQ